MTGLQSLAARGALGLLCTLATPLATRISSRKQVAPRRWNPGFLLAFAVSRLALFALIFLILRVPARGDVTAYYYPQALQILAGLHPYRDFTSSYAPLHGYIDAACVAVWHSPLSIIFFTLLVDVSTAVVWNRFLQNVTLSAIADRATMLYLISSTSLVFITIEGQNNVFIELALGIGAWLLYRERDAISGAAFTLSACCSKFLSLLYLPLFAFTARRPVRWVIGAVAPLALVYGAFAVSGSQVLQPLMVESKHHGAGCLPFVIEVILGKTVVASRVWDLILAVALITILTLVYMVCRKLRSAVGSDNDVRRRLTLVLLYSSITITLTLMLLSEKSWPNYMVMVLFPLCFLVAQAKPLTQWLFGLFQLVAVLEHSYWATVLNQASALTVHQRLFTGNAQAAMLMSLEVLLLAGYGWLIALSLRKLRLKTF